LETTKPTTHQFHPVKEEQPQPQPHPEQVTTRTTRPHLQWSGKLYGRNLQQKQLYECLKRRLERGNGKAELTIITGSSGTGKSILARRTLEEHVAFFLSGKCDQIQQAGAEPFAPFVSALTQLVEQLLSQKDVDTVQQVTQQARKAIQEVTEINLLTDMVPALKRLFPNRSSTRSPMSIQQQQQQQRSSKAHHEAENPSITVVCKLVRALCSPDRPIVLLIDDFQWIDSSSLKLFEALAIEKGLVGFMLLGTCRGNEVAISDPISHTLRTLEQEHKVLITDIPLENLSPEAVHELVQDAFHTSSLTSATNVQALSNAVYQHTDGNAFFVRQVLRSLDDAGYLSSHIENGEWKLDQDWSVDKLISSSMDCDGLVDLAIANAAKVSPVVDAVIKVASCLGSEFLVSHVLSAVNATWEEVAEALMVLEERHIVQAHNDGLLYSWTHDKFQKASYLLLTEGERELLHLSVGRQLLRALSDENLQRYIFVVTSQFCMSLRLLEEDEEKQDVATLLLRLGEKSALSSAFAPAASYFAMGTSLLREDHWKSQYDLSLRLYNAAAEMECCRGHFVQTDKLVNVILARARFFEDRLRAYETKIYSLGSRQQMPKAIDLALDVFQQLGERFPRKPKLLTIVYEIFSTKRMLAKRSEEDILGLRPLSDWKKVSILRIMQLVFPSVMRGCPELAPILACRCIKITLRHGLCGMSCAAFAAFGLVLTHPLGFVEEGNKYARIGMKIMEKFGVDEMKCRLLCVLHGFCVPYTTALRDTLEPLKAAAPLGLLTGDLEIACLSLHCQAITGAFCCSLRVEKSHNEMTNYIRTFREMEQDLLVSHLSVFAQMMENLLHPKRDTCLLTGDALNEAKAIERECK
jgi:predicted ATPase